MSLQISSDEEDENVTYPNDFMERRMQETCVWERLVDYVPRAQHVLQHYNGKLYVIADFSEFLVEYSSHMGVNSPPNVLFRLNPTPLSQTCQVFHKPTHSLYFFGGFYQRGTARMICSNIVWRTDILDVHKSREVECFGDLPKPTRNPCTCIYKDDMYVFGGRDNQRVLNQLHVLNLETMKWTNLTPKSGSMPIGRIYATIAYHQGYLYLFAGRDHFKETRLNDLWKFDIMSQKWSELVPLGIIPPEIASHSCSLWRNSLYFFGGKSSPDCPESSLYEYNILFNTFQRIETNGDVAARYWHAYDLNEYGELVVQGGFDDEEYLRHFNRIRLPNSEKSDSIRIKIWKSTSNRFHDVSFVLESDCNYFQP